jgi:hypothetical protein
MTTTLLPPEPAITLDHSYRLLSIAANLLPPEIVDTRRTRRVKRAVLVALCTCTVLLAGWYGAATLQTVTARAEVRSVDQEIEQLTRHQKAYADVIRVQADSQAIHAQLIAVLGGDLRWSTLISAVQSAAPVGLNLTGVTGLVTPTVAVRGAAPAGVPVGVAPIGSLIINGSGRTKGMVAGYVDALGTIPGLANPFLTNANEDDGVTLFTVRVDVTSAALGGRYSTKATEKAGK